MSTVTFPDFSGGNQGGGGGPAEITYPLIGPPGGVGNETFAFTSGGGLHGTSAGAVALAGAGGNDGIVITAQGDVEIPRALRAEGLASLVGGIATTSVNAATLTTTGNVGIGGSLGIQGSAQLTGDLSARKISASSDLTAGSLSTAGAIAGASLNITGSSTLGKLKVAGTFQAEQIQSDGALLFPVSDSSMPGIGLGEQPSTGIFGVTDTLGFAVAGNRVLSLAKNLTANFAGAVQAPSLATEAVKTQSLEASGPSALQGVSATTLTATGAAQLTAGLNVTNGLSVTGTTRLADLRIELLSTDEDLSVGGSASVADNLSVSGATTLGSLSASELTTGPLKAGKALLESAYMLAGPDGYTPVRREPVPNQPNTIDYVVTLDPGGDLAIAGAFFVGKDATVTGALSATGQLQAGSAKIAGAFEGGGAGSFAGQLVAPASRIAGVAFSAGSGNPGGQVTGNVGDFFVDRTAGTLYLKRSGQATNAGWVPVTTSGSSLSFPLAAPASAPEDGASYAFATSSGDGLGSREAGTLYLAVGNESGLEIGPGEPGQGKTVSIGGTLEAYTASATNLSAGSLSVAQSAQVGGAFTAASATVSGLLGAGRAEVSGALTAGSARLSGLEVTGNGAVDGNLTVGGSAGVTGQLSAAAALLNGSRVSAGQGSPVGTVVGSPGDAYLDRTSGDLWLKATGSATSAGWTKVATAASGTTFPLSAPDGSPASPSYGFTQGGLGLTATGPQTLAGVTNGQVGWTLGPDQAFALRGTLAVAGTATLAALSATSGSFSGPVAAASATLSSLNVSGATSLADVTAGATNAASLVSRSGLVAASTLTLGQTVIGPVTSPPSGSTGQQGDLALVTSGSVPLYVRGPSSWRAVALVGDAAPTNFPLRAPADSAAAPSFAWAASPGTGLFSPGANQLAFATNGTLAGTISAGQAWSLVGALSAGAATFPSLTVNGPLSATGNATIGGTLGVTGAVTLASSLTGGDIVSSGSLTAQSAIVNGNLSVQTATSSGDVTVGGSLTVNGTVTYAGIQRTGYVQTGDGTISSPAVAFTAEPGLGAWRAAAGTYAIAAGGVNLLALTSSLATLSGGLRIGGTNAGLVAPSTNTLALQTGGTTALSLAPNQAASFSSTVLAPGGTPGAVAYGVGNSTFGFFGYNNSGSLVPAVSQGGVTTTTFFRGVANNNYAVFGIGIGDLANPTPSATGGLGYILGSSTPPNGQYPGTAGSIYCHWADSGTTPAIYVNETPAGTSSTTTWRRVLTTSSTITPTFPIVGPAGSAASPTFQAAAGNGIYSGTDGIGRAILGLAQGGSSVGRLATFTNNSLPVWLLGLGDAASTSTSGGLLASAQAPATGAPAALPSMVYQYLGGGPGQALWVNESTGATPSWARVLTSSSQVSASFPLLANPDGTSSAPAYAWASETGLGWYRSATGTMVAVASGNPLATLAPNLVTLPGALRVGGTNAGLTSPGANQLALQVAGNAALSLAASGVATFGFQAVGTAGTAALPGLAVGVPSTGLWAGSDAFSTPVLALSVAGTSIGLVKQTTAASLPVFILGLGSPASSTVNGGLMVSAQAPQGSVGAFPSQLFQDTRGGSGCFYVYEGTTNGTSAWARVLTTSTPTPTLQLAQGSAPVAVAGQTRLWADTAGNLGVVSSQASAAGQTQYVRLDGQATVLAGNLTLTAGMSGATLVASATTGYTATLPASAAYDLRYYFQVENAAGLTIAAASGQLINIGGEVSTSGGTARTTQVGATIELFLRANTTTWFARGPAGTFVLA